MIASPRPSSTITEATALSPQKRYVVLDAYRGLIMLVLCSGGFGLSALSDTPAYSRMASWFDHAQWESPVFWDMIQPAFMFMVGVAMPFALARRMAEGVGFGKLFGHVAVRSLRLLLLSHIIMCIQRNRLHLQFTNVLAQIAFTYFFCFLIMRLKFRWQVLAAASILALHWALFTMFPGPQGPWSPTGNIGDIMDFALLGWRNQGHYNTLNFIPSTVTTLFGVWTGMLLRSGRPEKQQLRIMAAGIVGCFAGGWLLSLLGIPIVKRLWTASWTLYSTGWVLFMLLVLYWVVEIRGYRKWTFPAVVVGMNSVFIYTVDEVLRGWINKSLTVFTGGFKFLGTPAPVFQACAVLLVMWCLCYWLYRRRIFLKL